MTTTTAVTAQQLAQLADLDPSFFSKHRDDLPPSFPLHVQTVGRPQLCFDVNDVAQLVAQRTAHLSESICRLRLALTMSSAPLRIVEADGKHHVVHDDEPLENLDKPVRDALLTQLRTDRAANTKRRTGHPTTTSEQQP